MVWTNVNIYSNELLRSTVSPLGENKRGEFLQLIPPPNPRQRGKSSHISTSLSCEYMTSKIPYNSKSVNYF